MQEWLYNDYIFMYSIHNQGELVIGERFIKTLKAKIYEKITANNSNCFPDLIILIDAYSNYRNHSINKKLLFCFDWKTLDKSYSSSD